MPRCSGMGDEEIMEFMKYLHKDAGFILLCIIMVLVWGWIVSGCTSSSKCEEGHGLCPIEPMECCNGHAYDPRPR